MLAKKGIGLTTDSSTVVDKAYKDRVQSAWLGGVQDGGIHLVSINLWTGEGPSERNLALLHLLSLCSDHEKVLG